MKQASGERDLRQLLSTMNPVLRPEEYIFTSTPLSKLTTLDLTPICTFREDEGLTMIVSREDAERCGLECSYPSRMITLMIHSSLEAVGFLAVILPRLAAEGISANVVAAFYHDHLFVPSDRASEAMKILQSIVSDADK